MPSDAELREMLARVSLPWEYRPYDYDDWGFIRGPEVESLIGPCKPVVAIARDNTVGTDNHDEHRRNKTDPYEPIGRLIVAAVNSLPALLTRIEVLEKALGQCGRQFQFYADEHTSAGKLEKALTNQGYADIARTAIEGGKP
ncbi:hypothetical protein BH11PSE6_BH11PSE6_00130 [soil metagenome]